MGKRVIGWGITLIALVGFWTAFRNLAVPFWLLVVPKSPSEVALVFEPGFLLYLIYLILMAGIDIFLAIGILRRYDKARVMTMILSPAPFFGALLGTLPSHLRYSVPILRSIMTFFVSQALESTGVSFFSIVFFFDPFYGYSGFFTTRIFLGVLNLAIALFLGSRYVKEFFHKRNEGEDST